MNPRLLSAVPSLDALAPEVQRRLIGILERYLADLERGLSPNAEQLVAEHPDLAEPLRAYLGGLDFLHEAAAGLRRSGQTRSAEPDFSKRQLGDYTIVREIGRGGMGVVYEAKQISLDRTVALKVLPFAAVLDRRQIARFQHEAQAAAHLHHPNIVPVFAVGCDRGVHYYAMQYIEGQPLDLAIRQLRKLADTLPEHAPSGGTTAADARADTAGLAPSTWKPFHSAASLKGNDYFCTVAELGIQVAEALDHAHQCGIVHRDVKPSNLLLDDQGKVWITDFGLARFHTDGNLTASGDVLGTVRYMSPEQAAGKSGLIDQRTDVYSLGITLYELATLQDVFEGTDRQAFLRWISEEDARPPRQVNPAIPVDLETVLLKAICRSPQDRYATAKELADDLRRFLQNEPVLARRSSLADRAAKWARRHKTVVVASVALLAMLLIGSVVSTLLIATEHAKTKAALAQAEKDFQRAERNLRRAETHFRQLREVVDRFGAHHAEQLKDLPGAEPLRRELLADTLEYYRGFIEHAGDDPTLHGDLAVTYSKAAAVSEQIGDKRAALAAYGQATQLFEALATKYPDKPQYRAELALCHNNIGLIRSATGNPAEAEEAYRRAITIQKQLTVDHPDSDQFQGDLALTYGNLGLLASEANQPAEAEQAYLEAIRIQRQLIEKSLDGPDDLHDLAISYNNLSFLHAKTDPLSAESASREARSILEKLVEAHPTNTEYQSDLALSYNNLAALENHNGHPVQAEASYRRAIAMGEQLVRKSPSVVRFRRDLAISHNNLGRVYSKSNRPDQASEAFERARTMMQDLVDDDPNELTYRSSLGGILNNLGMVLEQLDRPEDAATIYAQAIEHQRFAFEHAPKMARFREFLGRHYTNYRRILGALGRWDEDLGAAAAETELWRDDPERLYRIAVELASAAEAIGPDTAAQDAVGRERTELAARKTAARQQYADRAVATLGEAIDAGLERPERIREDPDLRCIRNHAGFADLLHRLTIPQEQLE